MIGKTSRSDLKGIAESLIGGFHHHAKQHFGPHHEILGRGCLGRVMRDAPIDGVKIIAVGQIRAIIWTSWPAPEVMRRHA